MSRRARRVQERARLVAAMERALAVDVASWLARVGRVAAAHLIAGHEHAAEYAAHEMAHRLQRTMVARLRAIAEAAARAELAQVKAAGAALETKGLIDDVLGAATDWIAGYAADKVVQIAETTRKVLRRVILASHEPATPPRQLAKQIVEATDGEIGKARAIRIARTEAHTAAEKGSFEAMRTVNIEVVKEWGAVEDKRTRPAHAEADGQTVAMSEAFTVGGERMLFCGDPNASAGNVINCRCVTLYNPVLPTAEPEPVVPAVPVKPALGSVPAGATWGRAHEAAITKGMSTAEIAARRYVVEEGKSAQAAKQEFAAVVDGGKLVQKYPGAKQVVHISPEAAKLINDPSKQISFHHNHPSDGSFSEADIGTTAQSPGLYELWAHGNAGSAYRLRAVSPDVVAVTGEFRRVRVEVIRHLQSLISAQKMTVEQAQAMDTHAISVVLSRAGWFEYHAVLSPSKAEILKRRADVFDELVKLGLKVVQRATKAAAKPSRRPRFMIDLPSQLEPTEAWQEMLATLLAIDEQNDPGVKAAIAEVREELARRGV